MISSDYLIQGLSEDEKVVIRSERVTLKKWALPLIIVLVIIATISGIVRGITYKTYNEMMEVANPYISQYGANYYNQNPYIVTGREEYQKAETARVICNTSHKIMISSLSLLIIPFYFLWFDFVTKKNGLVITNKRVFGNGFWTKGRVDLPLDTITAVGKNFLYSMVIYHDAGKNTIPWIKNRDEMYNILLSYLTENKQKSPK